MRDLFFKLFAVSYFNTGIYISAFSITHIVYLFLIFGGIFATAYFMRNKSDEAKERIFRFIAYCVIISYISDFFVHDFVYGEMNIDKLPFHLCTSVGIVLTFVQFNKKFERFIEPVSVLAIVGSLMYLTYPASIGEGEPWCYQAVQTMFYHGMEMAWGILHLTSGKVKLQIKNVWQSAVGLGIVTLWAKFGNLILDYNWFFLEKDALYIGLVEDGVIPKWSLMILTPLGVFLIVLAIYGIYYGVRAYMKRRAVTETEAPTEELAAEEEKVAITK